MSSHNANKKWVIGVHVGAGYHNPKHSEKYKNVMKMACRAAKLILQTNSTKDAAIEAVAAAIAVLEDDENTNAGLGSNLTEIGTVECDATLMSGVDGMFGSVGAVPGVRNPILVARQLLLNGRKGTLPLGRIRPLNLVGIGAWKWAKENHFICANSESELNNYLITKQSKERWIDHLSRVKQYQNSIFAQSHLDTVGAVCMDSMGNIAAGVSSGGISLKHPGRVGEAGVFGCGCWAANETQSNPGVAVSCTGTGEDIMVSFLAKECATQVCKTNMLDQAIKFMLETHFKSTQLDKKYVGLITLKKQEDCLEFGWGYTTHSMALGYFSSSMQDPVTFVSYSKKQELIGKTANIGVVKI